MRSIIAVALLAALGCGCTMSGTIDNIPHRDPVQVTDVNYATKPSMCPEVGIPAGCAKSDVKCSSDAHGCEICACGSAGSP